MKKNKNILNIVFGSILLLNVIVACSITDDDKPYIPPSSPPSGPTNTPPVNPTNTPPDIPIGINSEFLQSVIGQEAVLEATKQVYAVFNESGDITVTSIGEEFTEIENSTSTVTTYRKNIDGSEVTLVVELIMVSENAIGASFQLKLEGVDDGSLETTKFLDTITDEAFVFMSSKTVDRTDLSAVQGTFSDDGKIFYPSVNYGWKSGLPADFLYYTLETGVFSYAYEDPAGELSFPVKITVDPSIGLGTLKVDAMTTYNVKFEVTP